MTNANTAKPDPIGGLFAEPLPAYQAHSIPSLAAAQTVRPKAAVLREHVYEWLAAHGPATDDEIAAGLGMHPNTARPRRIELVAAGRVAARGVGKSTLGNRATRWGTC